MFIKESILEIKNVNENNRMCMVHTNRFLPDTVLRWLMSFAQCDISSFSCANREGARCGSSLAGKNVA